MADIDEIDNKLINLLEQDAWQRPAALARILEVSPANQAPFKAVYSGWGSAGYSYR